MKKQLAVFGMILITATGIAQTAVSVANGNWTNPLTWNCTCVPIPGYSVTVNHSVTLNTSFTFTTTGMTINSGASLVKDNGARDLLINGGTVTNKGYLDVRFILAQSGAWSNTGTITARSIDNYINFTNTGVIKSVDSLRNSAAMVNNGKMLNVDSIMHVGTFTNNGVCTHHFITNTGVFINNNYLSFIDITNTGTLTNTDSIIGSRSMFNKGKLTNTSGALVSLTKSLLNKNLPVASACINNNGKFKILDSYYNFDTIRGISGSYEVQDSSVNYGYMNQSFDFCDLTCTVSPVKVDFNFGTVSPNITWCVNTGISNQTLTENVFALYPNPVNNRLFIAAEEQMDYKVHVINSSGSLIFSGNNLKSIDMTDYATGLYFISIETHESIITKKIQLIK